MAPASSTPIGINKRKREEDNAQEEARATNEEAVEAEQIEEECDEILREEDEDVSQAEERARRLGQKAYKANEKVREAEEFCELYSARSLDGREGEQRELHLQDLNEHIQVLREKAQELESRAYEAREEAREAQERRLDAILNAQHARRAAETCAELAHQAECRLEQVNQELERHLEMPNERASRLPWNREG